MAGPQAMQQWEQMRNESPENRICVDCGANNPQWASVSFGVLFCLECSGVHRSLGVHISFVRSLTMDSWSDKQLAMLRAGGNQRFKEFLQAHGVNLRTPIKEKYSCKVSTIYKEKVKAIAEGRQWKEPPPEAFVEDSPSVTPRQTYEPSPYTQGPAASSRPMTGFGSVTNAPLPQRSNESDELWNSATSFLGDSWVKISTVASSAAAVTTEYAKTAADKLAESSKDISSKLQEQGVLENVSVLKEKVAETSTAGWGLLSSYWNTARETVVGYVGDQPAGTASQQQQQQPAETKQRTVVDATVEEDLPRGIDDLLLKKEEEPAPYRASNGGRSLIEFEDAPPATAQRTSKTNSSASSGWSWDEPEVAATPEPVAKPSSTSPSASSSDLKKKSTTDDDWWQETTPSSSSKSQKKSGGWDESWDDF